MKIRDLLGYEIYYNSSDKVFEARKEGEVVWTEKTEEELEKAVKKLTKKTFKRFKAIHLQGLNVIIGEVTSLKKAMSWGSESLEAWFVWKEAGERRRRRLALRNLYVATPHNLEIAEKVLELNQERQQLVLDIKLLSEKLKDRLTQTTVLQLAGLEE